VAAQRRRRDVGAIDGTYAPQTTAPSNPPVSTATTRIPAGRAPHQRGFDLAELDSVTAALDL